MEELHCIAQMKAGNEEAFQYLFNLFYERLRYFARGITTDDLGAEDLVQDAFVQLWKHKEGFDCLPSVKAFLYLAVKNAGRNIIKHEKVVNRYALTQRDTPLEEGVIQQIIEAEVLADVHKALALLPEGCREVIHLCYFQGLKNQEAANQLQVSINTIKTQKVRGLRMLRMALRIIPLILAGCCHPVCLFNCYI
jgi:RNA polymerase sigma-70 factor (ECF subfamily)